MKLKRLKKKTNRGKLMTNLELFQLAENEHIPVDYFVLEHSPSASVEFYKNFCCILIDPLQTDTQATEKVVLAHELGHCITGSFYDKHTIKTNRYKLEGKAKRWSYKKLVPFKELQSACEQGYTEYWQLAEYFDVTEEFIREVVDYYKIAG